MHAHVETLVNILLGAAYADKKLAGHELEAIRSILRTAMSVDALPESVEAQIRGFNPAKLDVAGEAAKLAALSEDERRKVLEFIGAVHDSDDELDLAEDEYLRKVAVALGFSEDEYGAMALDAEVDEFEGLLAGLAE